MSYNSTRIIELMDQFWDIKYKNQYKADPISYQMYIIWKQNFWKLERGFKKNKSESILRRFKKK